MLGPYHRNLEIWLSTAIWLTVIAIESSSLGSSKNTGWILFAIITPLIQIDSAQFTVLHFVLRKTGHFAGYFILSLLLFRSWRATFPVLNQSCRPGWAILALITAVFIAALDEGHQVFLGSRTGALRDILLDSVAALVAQLTVLVVAHYPGRRRKEVISRRSIC